MFCSLGFTHIKLLFKIIIVVPVAVVVVVAVARGLDTAHQVTFAVWVRQSRARTQDDIVEVLVGLT
jgi:hypothetical protein